MHKPDYEGDKSMIKANVSKSYATFGLTRSIRQLRYALQMRQKADLSMSALYQIVLRDEQRIAQQLGQPVEGLRILEIGPGQGMERARYFGIRNEVIGLDLDVIPRGIDTAGYWKMFRQNGFGRFVKTVGRQATIGPANATAWENVTGVRNMPYPHMIYGDICVSVPENDLFNVVMSWAVFEHLPDPERALRNVISALQPGGVFLISLHLYTSSTGHHDIRAFTGREEELPMWAHLRESTRHLIEPSSYLNQWPLSAWRELFAELAPGHIEYRSTIDINSSLITEEVWDELRDYTKEELSTIDAIYVWKKPDVTKHNDQ